MDKTTLSKYGWIIITTIVIAIIITSIPVLSASINDSVIGSVEKSADTYVVKLDATGGSVNMDEILVVHGKEYGYLPTPSFDGWVFVGWYMEPEGGERITSQTVFNGTTGHTLYARWA